MVGYGQIWLFCPNKFNNLLNMALIRSKWDSALRNFFKNERGKGWGVEQQSLKIKLLGRNYYMNQAFLSIA